VSDKLPLELEWRQIDDAIDLMVMTMHSKGLNKPLTLVPILRGGMIPAQLLAYRLENRVEKFVPLTIKSYNAQRTSLEDLKITLHGELSELTSRHILLVDDIWDTGFTMGAAHGLVAAAKPASISCAVLVSKSMAATVYGIKHDPKFGWTHFPWEK